MQSYTLTVLIKHDLEEAAKKQLLNSITQKFSKLEKEDLWGNKDLSYLIKKSEKAYYAHFEFEAEPKEISSLDKSLKLNEDIIRYLLLRKD